MSHTVEGEVVNGSWRCHGHHSYSHVLSKGKRILSVCFVDGNTVVGSSFYIPRWKKNRVYCCIHHALMPMQVGRARALHLGEVTLLPCHVQLALANPDRTAQQVSKAYTLTK